MAISAGLLACSALRAHRSKLDALRTADAEHIAWRMMQKMAACLEMLQEGQQGMAGIHWLEAAQQISAISLLA